MMIVSDSSPLITLAKMGRLWLLREVYGKVAAGPKVWAEVIEGGRQVGAMEVRLVQAGLEQGWLWEVRPNPVERRLTRHLLGGTQLHEGEAEAIAVAHCRKWMAVLDDKEARTVAEAMGVEYLGTAGVLLEAFMKTVLNYEGLAEAVRELGRIQWLSPEVTVEILKTANGVRR